PAEVRLFPDMQPPLPPQSLLHLPDILPESDALLYLQAKPPAYPLSDRTHKSEAQVLLSDSRPSSAGAPDYIWSLLPVRFSDKSVPVRNSPVSDSTDLQEADSTHIPA